MIDDADRAGPAVPLLITADETLLDHALVAVAAAGLEAEVAHDLAGGRAAWSRARIVLVGTDLADALLDRGPPRSAPVVVIGTATERDRLCEVSAGLGAVVAVLPDHLGRLTALLADDGTRAPGGRVVAVTGGSGGVGASTLAAAIACRAAEWGSTVALVDADPWGGGLDLCLGAESVPGWRWPRLRTVTGHLDRLPERLPVCDGVTVVTTDRDDPLPAPDPAALTAVIRACRAAHAVTVVDLARPTDPAGEVVLDLCDRLLVVVGDEVRQVAAARSLLALVGDRVPSWSWVLRRGAGAGLSGDAVAETLDRRPVGVLPGVRAVRTAALRGDPPHRVGHRRWAAAVSALTRAVA